MKNYSQIEVNNFCLFIKEAPSSYLTRDNKNNLIKGALNCLEKQNTNKKIKDTEDVIPYLKLQFADEKREVFGVLFLDNKNRIIKFKKLFSGTINLCDIHPRIILQQSLELNAANVILVHNHPSGCVQPSDSDVRLTENLRKNLSMVDVKIIDHIIIGNNKAVSIFHQNI